MFYCIICLFKYRSYHFQDGSNLSEEQFVQRFVLILVKPLCEALGTYLNEGLSLAKHH